MLRHRNPRNAGLSGWLMSGLAGVVALLPWATAREAIAITARAMRRDEVHERNMNDSVGWGVFAPPMIDRSIPGTEGPHPGKRPLVTERWKPSRDLALVRQEFFSKQLGQLRLFIE